MNNKTNAIEQYLSKVPKPQVEVLLHIRTLVKDFVPEAEEVLTYGIPGFKYKGEYLIGYAAMKKHLGLYPTPEPIAALKEKLTQFELSKGSIRFTIENKISDELIKEIISHRMKIIKSKNG